MYGESDVGIDRCREGKIDVERAKDRKIELV